MAAGDDCMKAEAQTWAKHAAFPDGCAIDARDLAGYHPPTAPPPTGDSQGDGRDAQGKSLSDWEAELSPAAAASPLSTWP